MVVILRNTLELRKSIDDYHLNMYELAKNKSHSDLDVIKIIQQLDKKFFMLQKVMYEVRL